MIRNREDHNVDSEMIVEVVKDAKTPLAIAATGLAGSIITGNPIPLIVSIGAIFSNHDDKKRARFKSEEEKAENASLIQSAITRKGS